jgi:hypothetical protein
VWADRFLSAADIEPLLPAGSSGWRAFVQALLTHQQRTWPLLRKGLDGLSRVIVKEIALETGRLLLQHNPQRIVSTTAIVDDNAVQKRKCFLCPDALPSEEKGLPYGDEFVILCNPYPILPDHLTIVHRSHRPQAIAGSVEALMNLAHDLGPDFFLLYNGPKCGASAPDHLHFQAARRGLLPLEERLDQGSGWETHSSAVVSFLADYPVKALLLQGSDRGELLRHFDHVIECVGRITGTAGEPLINLIVTDDHPAAPGRETCRWTMVLFPRSKHRPACFSAAEDAQFLISPAAIDLAGLIVAPRREDFDRLTPEIVKDILTEVTLSDDQFSRLRACLETKVSPADA